MKFREIPIKHWIKAKLNSVPTDYTLSDRFYVDATTSRIYGIFSKPFNVEANILAKFNAHVNKKSIRYLGESNRELADISVGFDAGNIYGTVTSTYITPEFILMYKDTNMHVTSDFIHLFAVDLNILESEVPTYLGTDTGNLFLQLMYRIEKSDALRNNMYLCTTNILNKRKGYTLTDILQLKDFKATYMDKDNTDDFILSEMGFIPLWMSPTYADDEMDFTNDIHVDDREVAEDTTVLNMFYILEVFYQMYKLNDLVASSSRTLLRLLLDNCKTRDADFIEYFTEDCKTIKDKFIILFEDDPIIRISKFYEYIRNHKDEIKKLWIPFTFAQYVKYAQYIGYLEYRKNVRALCRDMEKLYALHTYKDTKEFTSWKDSSSSEDYKDLDKMFDEASASIPVAPLDCEDSTSEDSLIDKSKDASKIDRVKELRTLDILDKSSFSKTMGKYDIDVDTVNTSEEKSDVLKAGYNKLKESLGLITPTLIRQIKEIKVYNTGGKDTGKLKGKLDKKNLYRYKTDHRIFYDNNYKIKESDLAFGIILDVSGSMSGSGIKNGKLTMVLLHEVLTSLRINHEIITHTSNGKHNSIIKRYKLFNENKMSNVNKVYEILGIEAESGNCDSGALYFMQQELRRVRNKDKIVMMFSDGEPTECTGKELINQVEDMEKEGIRVIGIGINYPSIKNYYAHNANGKNIKDMVDIITQILKEYVLEKI